MRDIRQRTKRQNRQKLVKPNPPTSNWNFYAWWNVFERSFDSIIIQFLPFRRCSFIFRWSGHIDRKVFDFRRFKVWMMTLVVLLHDKLEPLQIEIRCARRRVPNLTEGFLIGLRDWNSGNRESCWRFLLVHRRRRGHRHHWNRPGGGSG